MSKTLNLITSFWNTRKQIDYERSPFDEKRGAFCQCGTDKFIESTNNPIEMRSFLMIGILIDQTISHGPNELYNEFRTIFRYPRLINHPTGIEGCPPSWFIFHIEKSGKADWMSIRNIYEILFLDTKKWFFQNNQVENFDKFKKDLMNYVEGDFKDYPEMLNLSKEIVN